MIPVNLLDNSDSKFDVLWMACNNSFVSISNFRLNINLSNDFLVRSQNSTAIRSLISQSGGKTGPMWSSKSIRFRFNQLKRLSICWEWLNIERAVNIEADMPLSTNCNIQIVFPQFSDRLQNRTRAFVGKRIGVRLYYLYELPFYLCVTFIVFLSAKWNVNTYRANI